MISYQIKGGWPDGSANGIRNKLCFCFWNLCVSLVFAGFSISKLCSCLVTLGLLVCFWRVASQILKSPASLPSPNVRSSMRPPQHIAFSVHAPIRQNCTLLLQSRAPDWRKLFSSILGEQYRQKNTTTLWSLLLFPSQNNRFGPYGLHWYMFQSHHV